METYSRQMQLPEIGLEGQKKLNASSILVIGIGGLGCAALPYLAASGIQRIGMLDFDTIEESNLARQTLFGPKDIGRWKAEAAKERLSALYSHVHFQHEICQLNHHNAQNYIHNYDMVLDGSDNLETRLAINDACHVLHKPWIYGSIHQWEGQVALFLPGNPDYRSLFPEGTSEQAIFNCSTEGVLGPFAGLIGAIQAMEAIKCLAGMEENLAGKLLVIDGKTWRFNLLRIVPTTIADYEISWSQLSQWMAKETVQLIDVREIHEKKSLNRNQKIAVYCQTGKRSLTCVRALRKEGFDAYSIIGGEKKIV